MKQYCMKVKEMKELLNTFDENQELIISVDVSTCEEDAENRMFANPVSLIDQGFAIVISAQKTEQNY